MVFNEGRLPIEFNHLKRPTVSLNSFEGDLTVAKVETGHDGSEEIGKTWEFPIQKGHFMEMQPSEDFTVRAAVANTQTLLGFAADKPNPKDARIRIPETLGIHTGLRRAVRVELLGHYIRKVPIVTGSPALGGSVKPSVTVAHKFDAIAQSDNGTYVLIAGDTGFATVLFLWRGKFA